MPRKRLTDSSVPRLRHSGAGKYTDFQDAHVPGLTLRVYPSGRRNWWHCKRGSSHRHKIGDFPEMGLSDATDAAIGRLTSDGDESVKKNPRVNDLVAYYIREYRTRVKRRRLDGQSGDAQYLRVLREKLGGRLVDEVSPQDVRDYLSHWDGRPYAQNRALQRLKAMYRWAIEVDWYDGKMPTRGISMNRERPRNRCTTQEEVSEMIETVWRYEPAQIATAVEITAIYGWRIGEVLRLRWPDVSGESMTVRDGKNGSDHTVPLTERAVALLDAQRRLSEHGEWVFLGARPGRPLGYRAVYDAWRRTALRAGITDFTMKDLRHFRVTTLLEARVARSTIGAITGHRDLDILDRTYHDVSRQGVISALKCEKPPGT